MYKYTGLVYRAYIQALMNQTLRERREVGLLVFSSSQDEVDLNTRTHAISQTCVEIT